MNNLQAVLRPSALGAAFLLAFGPAHAEEDIDALIKPSSSIEVGVAAATGDRADRAVFGQYNGMRRHDAALIFDVDYLTRDDATGTWLNFFGRNLGLENREMSFGQQRQGDWKYSVEYGELVRNYTNTLNTGLQGIGTTNLSIVRVTPGAGAEVDLKTTRKALGVNFEKWLTENLQFEASFKNEEKDGARMFGRGANCSAGFGCVTAGGSLNTMGALLIMPEPIDSTTRQFEAKLNYSNDKLLLSGAYYGSFFTNRNGSLSQTFTGTIFNPNGTLFDPTTATGNNLQGVFTPLALPPDNQSHQLSLSGSYVFSPSTKGNFKFSRTRGTQNESFSGMGFAVAPRGSLDAVVDTTLAQAGISSRVLPKLTLTGNLRFEQKSDKTPIAFYNAGGTNGRGSHRKIGGKFEASYQLPDNYRLTGGIDLDMRDLGKPMGTNDTSQQAAALRAKNDDRGLRLELRKAFSDSFSGSVGLGRVLRNGSAWMTAANATATVAKNATLPEGTLATPTALFPLLWVDSRRDKLKFAANWDPMERLSLQFVGEASADHYFVGSQRGARDGASRSFTVDAAYTISDSWKANAWFTHSDTLMNINGTIGAYSASLRQLNHSIGAGVRGTPMARLEFGSDLVASYEVNRYGTGVNPTSNQPNGLPAAAFRQLEVSVFGKYALEKNADLKLTLGYQRYYSNEWYWSNNGYNFFISDGTTVNQKDNQKVGYLSASYVYKWR